MLTLESIKGVGAATIKKLNELDIRSVFELFSFLPSKYIGLSDPVSVDEAPNGELALFEGTVEKLSDPSRAKKTFFVNMFDAIGKKLHFRVTFFNMPFLHDSLKVGETYRLLGRLSKDADVFNIVNPQMERVSKISKLDGVYPVYPLKGVMGQNAFKNIVYSALDSLSPGSYGGALGKINSDMAKCFLSLHRPKTVAEGLEAKEKLASLDLAITLRIFQKLKNESDRTFRYADKLSYEEFESALSFLPTPSQRAAFEDVKNSLLLKKRMSRIVSGDVGSGKTVVAFFALAFAAKSGYQAALMAPTEILAEQHAASFAQIAKTLGISFALLTSSVPQKEREGILNRLERGECAVVIGTQAIISEGVNFKDLALAVIDEQHRFGVEDRSKLEAKGAEDVLSLTATPIPRSMALTFYNDIAISVIQKREDAKTNIKTHIYPLEIALEKVFEGARKHEQAFIIAPSIFNAEGYAMASVESFQKQYKDRLAKFSTAVLHGRMSADDKAKAMLDFKNKKTDILVATSVVEVGIDTLAKNILILDADRFGLASLHQLRGRVGRDGREAHCYLVADDPSPSALKRLGALIDCSDGQTLAELDFEMRGAGDFIGIRQSGVSTTPIFGLNVTSKALSSAKIYCKTLENLSMDELLYLTRRSKERVLEFLKNLNKVTLNS